MTTKEYVQALLTKEGPLAAKGTDQYEIESEILIAASTLEYMLQNFGTHPKHDKSYLYIEDATECAGRDRL